MAAILEAPAGDIYAGRVEGRLRDLLDSELERWSTIDPRFRPALEALADLGLGGGKRLRAQFAYWAYVGAGGSPDAPIIVDAGAALELLHLAALIHDDAMDGSDRRRGRPTAHVRFTAQHRSSAWRGDPERFGQAVAIVLGDIALFHADAIIGSAPWPARRVFTDLRLEMAMGQFLDVAATAARATSVDAAQLIALFKSAKYTVERPLHLGAALAGRLEQLRTPLTAYGVRLGVAFQLQDDLLGTFGEPAVTGKPVGDDLVQGKPTLLIALAYPHLSAGERELLGEPKGRRLRRVLADGGWKRDVESFVEQLVAEAVDAVEAADLYPEARCSLVRLARFVGQRSR